MMTDAPKRLTSREADVVRLLCCGQSNKEIGIALGISHQTVKNHLFRIMGKWRVRGRVQILIYAFGHGLHDARQCFVDMGKM